MLSLLRYLLIALLATGCTIGAPLGFSSGKSWSFPLVAPLEEGAYLVPVKINGKGPYLFMIDPDAPLSSLDSAIRSDLDLYTVRVAEELDERDKAVPVAVAEVAKLKIGDSLTISNLKLRVHKFGTYWSGGRRVRGVIGRDIIADSLVFAANRDRGIATLAVQGHLAPPADATALSYRRHRYRSNSPRRRLASVTLNKSHKLTLHLDLGARHSMLWPKKMAALNLPKIPVKATMVDELATTRMVDYGAMVAMVSAAGLQANGLIMVPYGDQRTRDVDLDGSLGQSFFKGYNVTADWHRSKLWLQPRNPNVVATSKERLQRWGATFDKCANPACVEVSIAPIPRPGVAPAPPAPPAAPPPPADDEATPAADDEATPAADDEATPAAEGAGAPVPEAPRPPPPPPPPPIESYTLRLTREASAPSDSYEIVLEAVDLAGKPLGMPRLLATLSKGRSSVELPGLDATYGKSTLVVVDVSPFPRECSAGPCVWSLGR